MQKIKIFYDNVSPVESMVNTWLESNNILIKDIRTVMSSAYLVLVILYEELTYKCQYESDDTSAMNCKHCGRPKWNHDYDIDTLRKDVIHTAIKNLK